MKPYRVDMTLILEGPILSREPGMNPHGVDMKMHRDLLGRPALPETLVLGRLAEGWRQLFRTGQPGNAASIPGDHPIPASLRAWIRRLSVSREGASEAGMPGESRRPFWPTADWRCEKTSASQDAPLYRIQVDPATGAAAEGALIAIEAFGRPGEDIRVQGAFRFLAEHDQEAEAWAFWFRQGFMATSALGAMESLGFGWLKGVQADMREGWQPLCAEVSSFAETWTLSLDPDRPLCFPPHIRPVENRYASRPFIPGSAIKAVLADRLRTWGLLDQPDDPPLWAAFDALVVRHAQPGFRDTRQRALVPPCSWAFVGNELRDLARFSDPASELACVPAFQADWKDPQAAIAGIACGSLRRRPDGALEGGLARVLRIHTAIDPDRQTAAESLLFAQDCLAPGAHLWRTELHLPKTDLVGEPIAEDTRKRLFGALADALREPLGPLGQTDAFATVEQAQIPLRPAPDTPLFSDKGEAVVVLQSEALLLPTPWALSPSEPQDLFLALEAAWYALSGGALALVRHHSMVRPALTAPPGVAPYRPVLLHTEGSTFVLKATLGRMNEAQDLFLTWQRQGLPPHPETPDRLDWRRNPFLPTNGYGEICLNPPDPWSHRHGQC